MRWWRCAWGQAAGRYGSGKGGRRWGGRVWGLGGGRCAASPVLGVLQGTHDSRGRGQRKAAASGALRQREGRETLGGKSSAGSAAGRARQRGAGAAKSGGGRHATAAGRAGGGHNRHSQASVAAGKGYRRQEAAQQEPGRRGSAAGGILGPGDAGARLQSNQATWRVALDADDAVEWVCAQVAGGTEEGAGAGQRNTPPPLKSASERINDAAECAKRPARQKRVKPSAGKIRLTKKGKRAVKRRKAVCGRHLTATGLLTSQGMMTSIVVEGSMHRDQYLDFLKHQVVIFLPSAHRTPVLSACSLWTM
ncbi:hypothetical protein C8F04DRAFT_1194656 [Mycena alexandri]|uniref:Uncharacterized protein n=1 Tax=Mycena alexandri TaxID=1745969 RepID=A0AAD6S7X6_9AGAR|nr:hypothetical protein C8F04DRAFT_1194656 [Mycena alexandri]